jgi:hypothetical protein
MITEILEKTIDEVSQTNKFEISEFQLGKEPYLLLKKEIENIVGGISVNIHKVNSYMGIPVKLYQNNDDAIMYCLKIKRN